jgi:hypothetical protein
VTFQELLDQVVARSGEAGFLGSDRHLELLREYVAERDHELRVEWSADRTYYQAAGGLIALEQPPAHLDPADAAELGALSLDHELAHARFTNQEVYADFIRRAPWLVGNFNFVRWIIELFNYLEDTRLVEQVRAVEPDAAENLGRLNAIAARERIDDYEHRNASSPWVADPPVKRDQASVALIEQVLVGDLPPVHPDVEAIRQEVQPHVDAARAGTTEDVAASAAEIYRIVVGSLH